jgi:MarR family transcriptional regulator for hemolysin
VKPDSATKLLFGDVLASARERWIRAMAQRLGAQGFEDYRRSDPLVLRLLRSGEVPLGSLTGNLGLTRQGARKVVSGLVERHYARVVASTVDSRRRLVALTPRGREYLVAVVATLRALNDEVVAGVDADQLSAAYSVLEFVRENIVAPSSNRAMATTVEPR